MTPVLANCITFSGEFCFAAYTAERLFCQCNLLLYMKRGRHHAWAKPAYSLILLRNFFLPDLAFVWQNFLPFPTISYHPPPFHLEMEILKSFLNFCILG